MVHHTARLRQLCSPAMLVNPAVLTDGRIVNMTFLISGTHTHPLTVHAHNTLRCLPCTMWPPGSVKRIRKNNSDFFLAVSRAALPRLLTRLVWLTRLVCRPTGPCKHPLPPSPIPHPPLARLQSCLPLGCSGTRISGQMQGVSAAKSGPVRLTLWAPLHANHLLS